MRGSAGVPGAYIAAVSSQIKNGVAFFQYAVPTSPISQGRPAFTSPHREPVFIKNRPPLWAWKKRGLSCISFELRHKRPLLSTGCISCHPENVKTTGNTRRLPFTQVRHRRECRQGCWTQTWSHWTRRKLCTTSCQPPTSDAM